MAFFLKWDTMRRTANFIQGIIILLSLAAVPALAAAQADVPPEERFTVLKSELLQFLKAGKYPEVLQVAGEIRQLGVPVSDNLLYIEGKAFLRTGKLTQAKKALKTYIGNARPKAKFRKPAARLLARVEAKLFEVEKESWESLPEDERTRRIEAFERKIRRKKEGEAVCGKKYNNCIQMGQHMSRMETDRQLSTETKVKQGNEHITECRIMRKDCYASYDE